ncbi:MAG TPA: DinB family protein [Puia sp.]|nr:DinB family protein [Puia sp.]
MPLSASILTRLQHQHEALTELIEGLTEQQLKQRINPDKWSAFEHIAHLAAYQPMFLARLERIAAEETPSFEPPAFERYVAEKDPRFHAYLGHSLEKLTHLIPIMVQAIITHLIALDDDALLRTGLHPRYGKLTVTQWTQFYLLHEAHHLFTIFMLTQDLRTAQA